MKKADEPKSQLDHLIDYNLIMLKITVLIKKDMKKEHCIKCTAEIKSSPNKKGQTIQDRLCTKCYDDIKLFIKLGLGTWRSVKRQLVRNK